MPNSRTLASNRQNSPKYIDDISLRNSQYLISEAHAQTSYIKSKVQTEGSGAVVRNGSHTQVVYAVLTNGGARGVELTLKVL
jgi:hypothetical protein